MDKWLLKQNVLMATNAPHESIHDVNWKGLWKKEKTALAAQWTSDFDLGFETPWWYCILDRKITIDTLDSKNRYEIKKGLRSFYARKITEKKYAADMARITVSEWAKYDSSYKPNKSVENIQASFERLFDAYGHDIWGCFCIETDELVGFAHLVVHDDWIDFMSMKMQQEQQKMNSTYVLVYAISSNYDIGSEGKIKYISDGRRNVVHKTRFQEYLVMHFGWRMAYSRLNIVYRPSIKLLVNVLFPCRALLRNRKFFLLKKISIMLQYEDIARECRRIINREQLVK